jgi:RNase H-fold protein (predicted Holliday junction resolvase)
MEITIKLKTPKELEKIRRILKGEKIKVLVVGDKKTKRKAEKPNVPNEETSKTLEKTDKGEELIKCSSIEDFFKKLGI